MSAYLIASLDVKDPEAFARYREAVPATIEAYGGRYVVRGGAYTVLEGEWPERRLVVIEFPSREQAMAWYHSDAYAPLLALRLSAADGDALVVDGIDA